MSDSQVVQIDRQDRIAACFDAAVKMQSNDPSVRCQANTDALLDFLADEYKAAGGLRTINLDS